MLRSASCLARSTPDGKPFLCAEVKATLVNKDISNVLSKQVFPFMLLSEARYGLLASTRVGTDGEVELQHCLVDRELTGMPLTLLHPAHLPCHALHACSTITTAIIMLLPMCVTVLPPLPPVRNA